MTPDKFATFREAGLVRIPVTRRLLADLETPLSCFCKLGNRPWTYLLESVSGGEKWGRYSCIGLDAKERIEVRNKEIKRYVNDNLVELIQSTDPFLWINKYRKKLGVIPSSVMKQLDLPIFIGGLVGFFGYETIGFHEPKIIFDETSNDDIDAPDILLMRSEDVVVFDNLSGILILITHANPQDPENLSRAELRLDAIVEKLKTPIKKFDEIKKTFSVDQEHIKYSFAQSEFIEAVNLIKEHIEAGDAMQVVLSQRMSLPFNASPLSLYRALRVLNPSPYLFYLNLQKIQIVGSSPEPLARLQDSLISVRPIAGTRPRGKTETTDLIMEQQLLTDPKERAEHLMLIDLGRNDVGRISRAGSVEVTEKEKIEKYSNVMHIVSQVEGHLKEGLTALDVLRVCLPAGTLSGAPKIRAMQIIKELEPVKRGIYGGAIGYLGWDGNMDTAIAIRTAIVSDGILHIQAGAGVVADSIPEKEWEETLNKASAILRAVDVAVSSLDALPDKIGQTGVFWLKS